MTSTTENLEGRLVAYRVRLDDAIGARTALGVADSAVSADGFELIDLAFFASGRPRRSAGRLVGVAAAGLLLVGGGAIAADRITSDGSSIDAVSSTDPDTPPASSDSTGITSGTTQDEATFEMPEYCQFSPPATLYLGGPASGQNLAAPGFVFSMPVGTSATEMATSAIVQSVLGPGCGAENPDFVSSLQNADGTVTVSVRPPAAPTPFEIAVSVEQRDDAIGITGMQTATNFEVDSSGPIPTLTLTDGIPAEADEVSVRFKKGEDVWELLVGADAGVRIELAVPEVDRFPEDEVDWVLFTIRDATDHAIGLGAALVR